MTKKTTINKIVSSKAFWIIISLLASFLLWTYIMSTEETTIEMTFSNVKVVYQGADDLRATRGLIVTGADADTVSVRLKGTRRVLGNLSSADLSAVIDVSGISQAREMQVSYSLQYPTNVDKSSITVLSKSPETISFSVVQEANKTLEVKGVFTGSVKDGYTAEPIQVDPSSITLYGPQEELDAVDSICVYVTRTDLDKSIAPTNCPYVLLDKDGNKLTPKEITGNYDTVSVSMPVLMNKDLPLTVSLVGGAGATEDNCVVEIEPKSIQVAGDTTVLQTLNQLVVATVDLSSFATSYETTVTIPLDNNLRNLSGVTEATVRISVRGLETDEYHNDRHEPARGDRNDLSGRDRARAGGDDLADHGGQYTCCRRSDKLQGHERYGRRAGQGLCGRLLRRRCDRGIRCECAFYGRMIP